MRHKHWLPVTVGLAGLIGCVIPGVARAQVEYIDPAGGFTQVVTTTDRGVKTIHVSGQVGQGETLQEHAESAFAGVVRRLAQAGATPEDVAKVRIFVKDFTPDQYPIIAAARAAVFPEGHWPASTMVGIRELFIDTLRVEIEVTAVVAEPGVDLRIERFAPANGFSGAVAVTAHGVRTVYVAGQVGAGGGLAAQTLSVWGRVGERLAEAGVSVADVVKATTYIVDYDPDTDLAAYREGRVAALSLTDMPASTLLGVPRAGGRPVPDRDRRRRRHRRRRTDDRAGLHRSGHRVFASGGGARIRPRGGPDIGAGRHSGRLPREPGRPGLLGPSAAP